MKITILDPVGLSYNGGTLDEKGLGGSEAAIIQLSRELVKVGFEVTVYNDCDKPGTYDGVEYKDETTYDNPECDILIVSRSCIPFAQHNPNAKLKILWLHDTFIEGDNIMEELVVSGRIDHVFTLSDWHTNYILNADHGNRRNYEVLKRSVFQTRNGVTSYIDDVNLDKKDRNRFVYNASSTKGLLPLVNKVWPKVKERIPNANLTIIGGYYSLEDAQKKTVMDLMSREDLSSLDVTFTGIIKPNEVARIYERSGFFIYPNSFPETFGMSVVESMIYGTPVITNRFGALEENAIDHACYKIDYAIEPNNLFQNIDHEKQVNEFVDLVEYAYEDQYLYQQKQQYGLGIRDIVGWDKVALEWKQFFYNKLGYYLGLDEYRKVERIKSKYNRIFQRVARFPNENKFECSLPEKEIIIISPIWNGEDYIEKHILSVATQDYDNYKHYIINDMSDDGTTLAIDRIKTKLPKDRREKIFVTTNLEENKGAIRNQIETIDKWVKNDSIVMFLDGDDSLINNNTIFKLYNDLYHQGYEFTYGSMLSVADNIPLIAQEYPNRIKKNKQYRRHLFNWKIPYTHLRTVLGKYALNIDKRVFRVNNEWMKSGADNPLFYELIEQIEPNKIYCNKEIVVNYNDVNPLNDYKINGDEQNMNANTSYNKTDKRILVAIPTAKYIEVETFKSIWDLEVPDGYTLDFQYFYGYRIDQIRNLISEWAKGYDYLFSVDSDIVLPKDCLKKMIESDKDIISGVYIQRKEGQKIPELYMDYNGGQVNIPIEEIINRNEGVYEVAGCGFGCVLVKSEVFRKMEYPHFYYKSAIDHKDTVSEDIYFCQKARELGYTIWADFSIRCDHKGSTFHKVE